MSAYNDTLGYQDSSPVQQTGDERRLTLAQVCSPLFLYLTSFRRNATVTALSVGDVRESLSKILDNVRERCEQDQHLAKLLPKIWYAVVVTADQVLLSSNWSEKVQWSHDLHETAIFGTAEGGHRFYELVEEALSRPGTESAEIAEVMFTCMALGFQGEMEGDRKRYERKRMELYEKARLPGALGETLTPQAYGENATRTLLKMPNVALSRVIIVAAGALVCFFAAGYIFTGWRAEGISDRVENVMPDSERTSGVDP